MNTTLVALLGTAGVLTWRGLTGTPLGPQPYVALAVAALFLLIVGNFAPDLAAAFAVLLFLSVLLAGSRGLESLARVGTRKEA